MTKSIYKYLRSSLGKRTRLHTQAHKPYKTHITLPISQITLP